MKMKIVYLITGSGGSFYCGNCYRDMLYLKAIRKVPGITASAIPLYLPPDKSTIDSGLDKHVFFGAISMYLREKVPLLRNMPAFLDKIFDAGPLLKLAASQAGTTRTEGLENLTLNMIEGDIAFRKHEIDRLVKYIIRDGKPDVIHLSNALIIGLARQLKERLNVKIVCSLLNEDDWIDEMAEPYKSKSWELISQEARHVDTFVTPSKYYKEHFISRTGLSDNNIKVVQLGIETDKMISSVNKSENPAIGYFCRISYMNGFDKLVDAFIKLKEERFKDLTLHVCGGHTSDDNQFIAGQIKKIREHGFKSSVKIYPDFQGNKKMEFFNNVDVISVPVRKHDGYGLYILEANGAGIPVIQPASGAFPEIIALTNGGITYSPDNITELASALTTLLINRDLRRRLGDQGKAGVLEKLSLEKMSSGLSEIYNSLF
jgi:glycosyltransferase involved in cell wall biosynthesis